MEESMIIVGAGIAGLSTGCYARMNGYETTILEMHNTPGGLSAASLGRFSEVKRVAMKHRAVELRGKRARSPHRSKPEDSGVVMTVDEVDAQSQRPALDC